MHPMELLQTPSDKGGAETGAAVHAKYYPPSLPPLVGEAGGGLFYLVEIGNPTAYAKVSPQPSVQSRLALSLSRPREGDRDAKNRQ